MGKGILQGYAEFVQLHGDNADERAGKKSLEDIDRSGLDIGSAVLVFYCYIKDGDHHSGDKERPAKQCKELDCGLHPIEGEDVRAHVSHHGKEIRDGVIDRFVHPFQHGVPDGIGYLRPQEIEWLR